MESSTEILRKLLDERGIEHDDEIETFTDSWKPTNWTRWRCADGKYATYHHCEQLDLKRLVKYGCTPEQAIAATLGRGTCHSTTDDSAWCFACSECGKTFPRNDLHLAHNHGEINYCPNCGRTVER